jgi:hypothetical protein
MARLEDLISDIADPRLRTLIGPPGPSARFSGLAYSPQFFGASRGSQLLFVQREVRRGGVGRAGD